MSDIAIEDSVIDYIYKNVGGSIQQGITSKHIIRGWSHRKFKDVYLKVSVKDASIVICLINLNSGFTTLIGSFELSDPLAITKTITTIVSLLSNYGMIEKHLENHTLAEKA